MNWLNLFDQAWQFMSESFLEIFSDNNDYPATGIQPFDGDVWNEREVW